MAELAHLAMTEDEKRLFAGQLTRILEYASQIASLDTRGVPPMARVEDGAGGERADEAATSLDRGDAMRNAPEALAGLFVVPRVIGSE